MTDLCLPTPIWRVRIVVLDIVLEDVQWTLSTGSPNTLKDSEGLSRLNENDPEVSAASSPPSPIVKAIPMFTHFMYYFWDRMDKATDLLCPAQQPVDCVFVKKPLIFTPYP